MLKQVQHDFLRLKATMNRLPPSFLIFNQKWVPCFTQDDRKNNITDCKKLKTKEETQQ